MVVCVEMPDKEQKVYVNADGSFSIHLCDVMYVVLIFFCVYALDLNRIELKPRELV